jgi:hypothetical protein
MTTVPAVAQQAGDANMEILMEKLKADKKLVVAMNMNLSDSEAKKFWPLYKAYQTELDKINTRTSALISEYANAYNSGQIPNSTAERLVKAFLHVEADELKLKIANFKNVQKVLPAVKVARYIQIESKIRAIFKFGLANEVPLVY